MKLKSRSKRYHWLLILSFLLVSSLQFAQPVSNSAADSIYEKAMEYSYRGAYDKSLKEYLKAIRIYESTNNHIHLSRSYNSVGLIYGKLKKVQTSRDYYNKALAELEVTPDKLILSYVLNNIAMSMENQNRLDSAALFYQRSLDIKVEINDSAGVSRTLNNIGGLRVQEKKYKESLKSYFQSLAIKKELSDTLGMARTYSNIANVYGWMNQLDSTRHYLLEGMKFTRQLSNQSIYVLYYQNFSALHSSKGEFELAYHYLDSCAIIQRVLFHEELASEIAKHQIIYETEKKDADILSERLKNTLLKEKQKRERKEKWIYITLSIILSLILILLYFIIKNRSQRMRLQQVLHDKEMRLNQISIQKSKQQEKLLEKEIELKSNELLSTSTLTLQKQEIIVQLRLQLENLIKGNSDLSPELVSTLDSTFKQNMNLDQEWERFKIHFDKVHTSFFNHLMTSFPILTESDLRHCAYIKIGLTTKEIAILFNISPSSVQKSRVRLKKKLSLSKDQDLYKFIRNDVS